MNGRRISHLRAIRLIACLGLRRLVSRYDLFYNARLWSSKPEGDGHKRSATRPKRSRIGVVGIMFVATLFLWQGIFISQAIINNVRTAMSASALVQDPIMVSYATYSEVMTTAEILRKHSISCKAKAIEHKEKDQAEIHLVIRNRTTGVLRINNHKSDFTDFPILDVRDKAALKVQVDSLLSHFFILESELQSSRAFKSLKKDSGPPPGGMDMVNAFFTRGPAAFDTIHHPYEFMFRSGTIPGPERPRYAKLMGILLAGIFIFVLLSNLAGDSRRMEQVAWDLEWLYTMPVSTWPLLSARAGAYAMANPIGWVAFLSFIGAMFWTDFGWWSLPLSLVFSACLVLLVAGTRLMIETWLRLKFSAGTVRNLQALCLVLSMISVLGIFACAFNVTTIRRIIPLSDYMGAGISLLPITFPCMLLTSPVHAVPLTLILSPMILLTCGGCLLVTSYRLRNGLMVNPGTYSGKRGMNHALIAPRLSILRGIVGKELRILARDRNFLAQVLIVPLFFPAYQLLLNPGLSLFIKITPQHLGAAAYYGFGAYVFLSSAMKTLVHEGKGLWLLYTLPRKLDDILIRKAMLWGIFSCLYAVIAITWGAATCNADRGLLLLYGVIAICGIIIYAFIAAGIGILAAQIESGNVLPKFSAAYIYLYMLLGPVYLFAFYASTTWGRIGVIIICSMLATAIWQKACLELPFLLDPTARPEPRITAGDGMIAIVIFFGLQGILRPLALLKGYSTGFSLLFAYTTSGIIVTMVSLISMWRQRMPDILHTIIMLKPEITVRQLGAAFLKTLKAGIAGGSACVAFGYLYLTIIPYVEPLRLLKHQADRLAANEVYDAPPITTIIMLTVIAAPLVEEYIFRGLLFHGLRKGGRMLPAVIGSAAIFAVVHPALSAIPVFFLGCVAAAAFESTGMLLAPILVHMIYNAGMVALNYYQVGG